jgi:DNA-binding response OmpR family regulator
VKSKILIVDDNEDILFNIKLILETNNFHVLTAKNGKEALDVLNGLSEPPEIIISDIAMPIMDGYDFFNMISENIMWNRIPFIFLTARSTPEDIRFGRTLGVDDYLVKPFKEEDLLAIISGKLARHKKIKSINKKVEDLLLQLEIEQKASISEEQKGQVYLILVIWDDRVGPELRDFYPKEKSLTIPINNIGTQLFQSTVAIYAEEDIKKAEGILLYMQNIEMYGYIFFDAFPDSKARAGERQFMLGVIAPKINYFNTFKIRELFNNLSKQVKNKENLAIKEYWEKISDILLTPVL